MWPPELYEERHVELVLGPRVASIDPAARTISSRGRHAPRLRRAAARDGRRSRAAARSRQERGPDSLPAHVRGQPGDCGAYEGRLARRCRRRQLHRPRGLGLVADARHQRRRRRAGSRCRWRRSWASSSDASCRASRSARCRVPPRADGGVGRWTHGHAERRRTRSTPTSS